ncbi:MAG: metal ABC transporter ATP-binding protein [Deltaproteobacteria bacterium]|jgi:zinc transport system ATP-binding protein|nr:metal ABC transporter ATP-binding protein [Deltaproteobacteria bacterium]
MRDTAVNLPQDDAPDRPAPGGGASCHCCAAAASPGVGRPGEAGPHPAAAAGEARAPCGAGERPAVEVSRLGVSLGRYEILRNVSLTVPPRRQTVVIGPNGAGKSTLVRAILGEIDHTGAIAYSPERPRFGYVPQRLDFDRHLPLTVAEFMALGRSRWPVWLGTPRRVRAESLERLAMVRAEHLHPRPLGSLSGGESQRVFLARALMADPDILVLDEPATGVDVIGEQLLCEILEGFKRDFTVLMVSHDLAAARAHGDWIVCLNRTVVAEGAPEDIFRPEIISLAFGIHQSLLFSGPAAPTLAAGQGPAPAPAGPARAGDAAGEGAAGGGGPAGLRAAGGPGR